MFARLRLVVCYAFAVFKMICANFFVCLNFARARASVCLITCVFPLLDLFAGGGFAGIADALGVVDVATAAVNTIISRRRRWRRRCQHAY